MKSYTQRLNRKSIEPYVKELENDIRLRAIDFKKGLKTALVIV
jgi:hypothetical protein